MQKKIKCGRIEPHRLSIPGKPNRVMTPEVKNSAVWTDQKNDYQRQKEKQKIRRASKDYEADGFFLFQQPSHKVPVTINASSANTPGN